VHIILYHTHALRATLHVHTHTAMSTHLIPRKEVGRPTPAHLKEVGARTDNWDPGWGIPEVKPQKRKFRLAAGSSASRWAIVDHFNRLIPPHKRYLGHSRRTLFIVVGVLFLCLLALIIGLAVGLKGGSKYVLRLATHCLTLIHNAAEFRISHCLEAPKHTQAT